MTAPESSPIAVCFEEVRKSYGRQVVLDGFSLRIAAGEFFGLVGINGAGKTTCIKGLLDFCELDSGTVRIFGVPHSETHARTPLAYLPERFLPPYYLKGRDFMRYMARLHRIEHSTAAVRDMCARLDLDAAALQKPVAAYSKGMAQKLGLAACLLSARELFVLDEPMSGLDPKARSLVKRELLALRARRCTVFFSTHLLADVEELCDRMGVLHEGRLRFLGSPAQCREAFGAASLEEAYMKCIEQEHTAAA